eukprot:366228-Chlamydomonas_euryale.AAC.31
MLRASGSRRCRRVRDAHIPGRTFPLRASPQSGSSNLSLMKMSPHYTSRSAKRGCARKLVPWCRTESICNACDDARRQRFDGFCNARAPFTLWWVWTVRQVWDASDCTSARAAVLGWPTDSPSDHQLRQSRHGPVLIK